MGDVYVQEERIVVYPMHACRPMRVKMSDSMLIYKFMSIVFYTYIHIAPISHPCSGSNPTLPSPVAVVFSPKNRNNALYIAQGSSVLPTLNTHMYV